MACDDEVLPLQERIEWVADGADPEEAYDTERQLPYAACTRARDHLVVAAVAPESEFLGDFKGRRASRSKNGLGRASSLSNPHSAERTRLLRLVDQCSLPTASAPSLLEAARLPLRLRRIVSADGCA